MTISLSSGKSLAIFVNGHLDYTFKIAKRVKEFSTVVLIDGGANLYHTLAQKFGLKNPPSLITGDLDSIKPEILSYYKKLKVEVKKLNRAKDQTDLEYALEILNISQYAETVIFGGIGGRVDHTLGNLFLLLRYPPQKLYFETENERISLIHSDRNSWFSLNQNNYSKLSFFSFYDPPSRIILEEDQKMISYSDLELKNYLKGLDFHRSEKGDLKVFIDKGQLLCVEHNNTSSSDSGLETFSLLSRAFENKDALNKSSKIYKFVEPSEKYSFECLIGETISLIPLFESAKCRTQGLKWELGDSFEVLDKQFIGISNVSMSPHCEIAVVSGCILCIRNLDIIDIEMVLEGKESN